MLAPDVCRYDRRGHDWLVDRQLRGILDGIHCQHCREPRRGLRGIPAYSGLPVITGMSLSPVQALGVVAAAVTLINIPFGFWRAGARKFSLRGFWRCIFRCLSSWACGCWPILGGLLPRSGC